MKNALSLLFVCLSLFLIVGCAATPRDVQGVVTSPGVTTGAQVADALTGILVPQLGHIAESVQTGISNGIDKVIAARTASGQSQDESLSWSDWLKIIGGIFGGGVATAGVIQASRNKKYVALGVAAAHGTPPAKTG